MSSPRILVIDDEPDIRDLVRDILMDEGYGVSVAENAHEARTRVSREIPDLALLDVWMPDEDGISLLKSWQAAGVLFPVIVMSGHGTIETAVEATRLGARTFIEKPLTTAKLLQAVRSVLAGRSAQTLVRVPAGSSRVAKNLRNRAQAEASSDAPLVIYGEYGTGKTSFAEYLHSLSARAQHPFIVLEPDTNAAGLTRMLARSVGGTLLTGNIAAQSAEMQKLLAEVLEQGRFTPPNSEHSVEITSRIMITAEEEPEALVRQKKLVPALARALGDSSIRLPALIEHVEDIPELITASVDYHCQKEHLSYRRFSIAAQNHLLHYAWPGSLRELDAFVYHLLSRGGGDEIGLEETRAVLSQMHENADYFSELLTKPIRAAREAFEKIYLEHCLREVGGSMVRLAERSGMERTHLYRKMKRLRINLSDVKKTQQ